MSDIDTDETFDFDTKQTIIATVTIVAASAIVSVGSVVVIGKVMDKLEAKLANRAAKKQS